MVTWLLIPHRKMVDKNFSASTFIIEPKLSIGSKEQVYGRMFWKRVQRGLSEASYNGSLSLDGNNLWLLLLLSAD